MYHLAVDISNWQGELTTETLDAFKAAGVERVIVRASTEDQEKIDIAKQQMGAVMLSGLELQVYLWLYWDPNDPPEGQRERCIEAYKQFPITRCWIDCEGTPGFGPGQVVAFIWWSTANPLWKYGIYTRSAWWLQYTGGSRFFDYLPFWLAGTWLTPLLAGACVMAQYSGEILGGMSVDVNLYRDELEGRF